MKIKILIILTLINSSFSHAKCIFDPKEKGRMRETLSQMKDVNVNMQIEWAAKQCASIDKSISNGTISEESCSINGTAKLYGVKFNICKWENSKSNQNNKTDTQQQSSAKPHYYFQ